MEERRRPVSRIERGFGGRGAIKRGRRSEGVGKGVKIDDKGKDTVARRRREEDFGDGILYLAKLGR